MPRVEIPLTVVERSGTAQPAVTVSDATNDHYVASNDGRVMLEVTNVGGSPQTVEVVVNPSYTADGLVVSNLSVAVAAGATVLIGPFRTSTFRQSGGQLWINPSVTTDLEMRAYQLPTP